MKVEMFVRFSDEEDCRVFDLESIAELFSSPRYITFEIRIDGNVVFMIDKGQYAEVDINQWLELDRFLRAFEPVSRAYQSAELYGTSVIVRDPDGTMRQLAADKFVITEVP